MPARAAQDDRRHFFATLLLRNAADRCGELRKLCGSLKHVFPAIAILCGPLLNASDGTRTRDLRRDRPGLNGGQRSELSSDANGRRSQIDGLDSWFVS
jgi:hypothetical protein